MTDGKVTDNGGDVHTPGPWIIDLASDEIHDTKGNPIATTWCHAECGPQTEAANARLIAAAPALLSALQRLLVTIRVQEMVGIPWDDEVVSAAETAVDWATGQ